MEERYSDYIKDFDEDQVAAFFELMSKGYSPQVVAGTIYYVSNEDELSQAAAAQEYGTNTLSIRQHMDRARSALQEQRRGGSD